MFCNRPKVCTEMIIFNLFFLFWNLIQTYFQTYVMPPYWANLGRPRYLRLRILDQVLLASALKTMWASFPKNSYCIHLKPPIWSGRTFKFDIFYIFLYFFQIIGSLAWFQAHILRIISKCQDILNNTGLGLFNIGVSGGFNMAIYHSKNYTEFVT